ncbi:hypothetical protein [Sphingosinicella sp. BN140058]|uniref:hypothetical protein n=1 Tax=Sphingosinicella sp. BN140058 TaxID=1892855 RepID=UPI001011DB64|nr:hypothetical protein [Sphingosinicella sp. BN140058]QAY77679.1 hypothetical protein ETR14_15040 [Sphingosinicella sp. BN140058]
MKIVIYGLAKSGTSALFYKIRNSLPAGTISLFEPSTYTRRERLLERLRAARRGHFAPDVLAKLLPWDWRPVRLGDFDDFDRQILLVRDPRDRLVSALLYKTYNASFVRDASAAADFLDLVRRKEANPGAVTMLRLLRTFDALEEAAGAQSSWMDRYHHRGVTLPLRFHDERPHLPVFRYEQLVDSQFGPLEEMLGLSLGGAAKVPDSLQRVVRTKGYGAWRNWFTPEDVAELRPLFQAYLDRYYSGADWDLQASPAIDAKHGSIYVERVINERRGLWNLPPLPAET